jgi:phytoene/squalene synthetase
VLLNEITQSGDAVLHQRLLLTPARKAWLCWLTRWGWGTLPR